MRVQGFNLLPPVVKNLLIINGLMFLISYTMGKADYNLSEYLGLHYIESSAFRPWQIVTHMFMHGSFSHLALNMFAVWMFGNSLENRWGSKRFLIFYMASGIGAALLYSIVQYFELAQLTANLSPADLDYLKDNYNLRYSGNKFGAFHVPALGASGALFGILMAFGMTFPNSILYLYFMIPVKVKYFVIVYGLIELFSGLSGANDGVAHFAHLGGMLFGYLLLKYWRKTDHHFY